jgi:hypothetical protein
MSVSEVISIASDVTVALASFGAVCIAWRGLDTWRRQLKGQTEYDLARRVLVSLFKFRDAIYAVRHPAMWVSESPTMPDDNKKSLTREEVLHAGRMGEYEKRWERLNEPRSSLYADLIEAEAIWGPELKKLFDPIYGLQSELRVNLEMHLELVDPNTPQEDKDAIAEIEPKKRRRMIYDRLSTDHDDFRRQFEDAVKQIEEYLRPKLKSK